MKKAKEVVRVAKVCYERAVEDGSLGEDEMKKVIFLSQQHELIGVSENGRRYASETLIPAFLTRAHSHKVPLLSIIAAPRCFRPMKSSEEREFSLSHQMKPSDPFPESWVIQTE